mgnify:CR=1 FL=1
MREEHVFVGLSRPLAMSSLTYGAVAPDNDADAGSTVAAPAENRRAGLMFAAVGAFVLSAMALTKGAVSHGKGNGVATALRGVANAAAVGTKSNVKLHDVRCGTNPLMRLSCEVHFGVFKDAVGTGEITEVTVQHVPSAGTKSMVYSSGKLEELEASDSSDTDGDSDYTFFKKAIYRVRPATEYKFAVYEKGTDGTVAEYWTTYTAPTGIRSDLDAGKTLVSLEGKPTFELLSFAWKEGSFRGIVSVDRDGYMVWYLNASSPSAAVSCDDGCDATTDTHIEAFGQIKDGVLAGAMCINNAAADKSGVAVMHPDGAGASRLSNSDLYSHADSEAAYTQIAGHECRPTKQGNLLLAGTEMHKLKSGSGESVLDNEKVGTVYREFIMEWNPQSNKIEKNVFVNDVEPLQQVLKAFKTNRQTAETLDIELMDDTYYDDDGALLEYIHISSICTSWDGEYYIVSMRDANGVFALERKTLELAWVLGGELPRTSSSFEFGDPAHDRFSNPHDAKLFAPDEEHPDSVGTLCLVDDGGERPGCEEGELGCYSRGVCYHLDKVKGTATKTFDFSYPNSPAPDGGALTKHEAAQDIYNKNGGAFAELHGGYFIAFTSIFKEPFSENSWAFEVSKSGKINMIAKLPHIESWTGGSDGSSGLYRVEVLSSINGERSNIENVGDFY